MAYFLSPILNEQQFDANGDPRSGALITTYLAGTLTPVTTYKTSTGTAHTNPIQLDSSGNYPNGTQLWLLGGLTYKLVITDSDGSNSRTYDNISGIGDNANTTDEWLLYAAAPTYIGATSFSVAGDQTNIFQVARRLKSTNTGGTVYSTIFSSAFAAGITTVTVINTSGVLDSGLSQVSYGLLASINPSVPAIYAKIAEATTTTTTGTSTAFVATPFPAVAGNAAPAQALLSFHVAPTGTPTLAVSGFAALPLKYRDSAGTLQTLTAAQCPINWRTPVYTDGTNWIISTAAIQQLTQGTAQATTSGTSIDFTSIPSWVKRITLMLDVVSGSGTSNLLLQLGDSGGIENTGYTNSAVLPQNGTTTVGANSTAGFLLVAGNGAALVHSGSIRIENLSGNLWVMSGILARPDSGVIDISGGSKTLTATLDRIRLTTAGGVDTFDAGSANILYE